MGANRRGSVQQSGVQLQLFIYETQLGANDLIPRPIWGNATAGLHYQPVVGDEVIALAEVAGWNTTVVPATIAANITTVMQPGETALLASDGRQAPYLKSDGSTQLYNKSGGASVSVSTAQNFTVTVPTAGTIALNASSTGTLTFTGAATFNQSLTVTGTTTLAVATATSLNAGSGTIQTTGSISGGTLTATTSSSLAAATATSLAINGATLGTNKLATSGTTVLGGDTTINGKLYRVPPGTPTIVKGSGFSAATLNTGANDERGIVSATVGTAISSIGTTVVATVTFAAAYTVAPTVVVTLSSGAVVAGVMTQSTGTGSFQILLANYQTATTITVGTVLAFHYIVQG